MYISVALYTEAIELAQNLFCPQHSWLLLYKRQMKIIEFYCEHGRQGFAARGRQSPSKVGWRATGREHLGLGHTHIVEPSQRSSNLSDCCESGSIAATNSCPGSSTPTALSSSEHWQGVATGEGSHDASGTCYRDRVFCDRRRSRSSHEENDVGGEKAVSRSPREAMGIRTR